MPLAEAWTIRAPTPVLALVTLALFTTTIPVTGLTEAPAEGSVGHLAASGDPWAPPDDDSGPHRLPTEALGRPDGDRHDHGTPSDREAPQRAADQRVPDAVPDGGCTPHPTITITEERGEQGFAWTNPVTGEEEHRPGSGVVAGEGTAEDPYVIEGWCILPESEEVGIRIQGTDEHVLVRHNVVDGRTVVDDPQDVGVILTDARNVTVEDNRISNHGKHGIRLFHAHGNAIAQNSIQGNNGAILVARSNGTTIEGNEVQSNRVSWGAGIQLEDANRTTIRGNELHGNGQDGILLDDAEARIEGNTIAASAEAGIDVYDSHATILENTLSDHDGFSIVLRYAGGSQLSGNAMEDAGLGVPWWPSNEYDLQIDATNTVNGDPLRYLHGEEDTTITTAGQVLLVDTTDVRVEDVHLANASVGLVAFFTEGTIVENATIRDNLHGVETAFGRDLTVANTTLADNVEGALIDETEDVSIRNTRVHENRDVGVNLYFDASADVRNTTIEDNGGDGIRLDHGSRGTIEDNVIAGNGDDAVEIDGDALSRQKDVALARNNIEDNGHRDLVVHGSKLVDARDNWWGHASGPSGDVEDACTGATPDGDGMSIATGPGFFHDGEVCFDPWLTSPNPDAGAKR